MIQGHIDSIHELILAQQREDKIANIRRELEAGTYETVEKIDGAIDNLLDEIELTAHVKRMAFVPPCLRQQFGLEPRSDEEADLARPDRFEQL